MTGFGRIQSSEGLAASEDGRFADASARPRFQIIFNCPEEARPYHERWLKSMKFAAFVPTERHPSLLGSLMAEAGERANLVPHAHLALWHSSMG